MPTSAQEARPDQSDPVFHGGGFDILYFTRDVEGLEIHADGAPQTQALSSHDLPSSERELLAKAKQGEMQFKGANRVREARGLWRTAISESKEEGYEHTPDKDAAIEALKANFLAARDTYRARSKKVGLRNLKPNPENPNHLTGDAVTVHFPWYKHFSNPDKSEAVQSRGAVLGVAMALTTSDGYLVVQHRAVEKIDPVQSRMRKGNAVYTDIPGASAAGLVDGNYSRLGDSAGTNRRPGTPDTVTTSTLTKAMMNELGQETGLDRSDLERVRAVGFVHDNIRPHDEVLFLAETKLSAAQVREASVQSGINKGMIAEDLAEKFFYIDATPEAIETLLSDVRCPLPPTHAAAYTAAGYMMVLQRDGEVAADTWAAVLEDSIARNYQAMDQLVQSFYRRHPEAKDLVPERMWGKAVSVRNTSGYDPNYTPQEQGLPELFDELVRTGLLPELRKNIGRAALFDVDGTLTDPIEKKVVNPEVYDEFIDRLAAGEAIGLNTGRSVKWVEGNFMQPLVQRMRERDIEPSILERMIVVGEKGGTWATYDANGLASYGRNDKLAIPATTKKAVRKLIDEKYADAMFFDDTKETMISVEMRDGYNMTDFSSRQAELQTELQQILAQKDSERAGDKAMQNSDLIIDATTIATDIQSKHVGKDLGSARFLEFLEARHITPRGAAIDAYGDSPSDLAMASHLKRLGLHAQFVYVGPEPKQPLLARGTRVHMFPGGFTQATVAHLRRERVEYVVSAPQD